jgi:hypothetical protein
LFCCAILETKGAYNLKVIGFAKKKFHKTGLANLRFWTFSPNDIFLLLLEQPEALPFPFRRQRLEQIIKLKRGGLSSSEDRFGDVWCVIRHAILALAQFWCSSVYSAPISLA